MLSPNEVEDIKVQAYGGCPYNFRQICDIYPLKIKEILNMGIKKYRNYLGTLLLTETEIKELMEKKIGAEIDEEINPLVYLLQSAEYNDSFFLELQDIFSTFIREEVYFLPKMKAIVIGSPEKKRMLTPTNFSDFQDILRIQNQKQIAESPPANETAWERKMRLSREKVAAIKKKQSQKDGNELTFQDQLEIADTFGIDSLNCTLVSFYAKLRRAREKEKWEQDLQMLCAGADSSKIKTKYWGESSEEK